MKKILSCTLSLCIAFASEAQRTDLFAEGKLSFLSFGGNGAKASSMVNKSEPRPFEYHYYLYDQYGKYAGSGQSFFLTLQRHTKASLVFGLSTGPEKLKNRISTDSMYFNATSASAPGTVVITYNNIDLMPFFGYRFGKGKITIDATAFADLSFPVGKSTGVGQSFDAGRSRDVGIFFRTDGDVDIRTGLQFAVNWNNFSFTAGYCRGRNSYDKNYSGLNKEISSRIFRTGIRYRWIRNSRLPNKKK